MADVVGEGLEFGDELIQLGYLLLIGVAAYLIYRAYNAFVNSSNCGPNKDQPCCSFSDINTSACVDSSGNPCGWSQFFSSNCSQSASGEAAV